MQDAKLWVVLFIYFLNKCSARGFRSSQSRNTWWQTFFFLILKDRLRTLVYYVMIREMPRDLTYLNFEMQTETEFEEKPCVYLFEQIACFNVSNCCLDSKIGTVTVNSWGNIHWLCYHLNHQPIPSWDVNILYSGGWHVGKWGKQNSSCLGNQLGCICTILPSLLADLRSFHRFKRFLKIRVWRPGSHSSSVTFQSLSLGCIFLQRWSSVVRDCCYD